MNGFDLILYRTEKELATCHTIMAKCKEENDAEGFKRWLRYSMECEKVITFIKQEHSK